jgi:hypothetical protein
VSTFALSHPKLICEIDLAGETFGWGPSGSRAIVFVDRPGCLHLLDGLRRTQTLGGVRNAWMPAWSGDGAQIAFVRQSGRRTYRVMTAAVTAR